MVGWILCLFAAPLYAQTQPSSQDVNQIVSQMVQARQNNRARMHSYTVRRDYQLLDKKSQPKAQVVAAITVLPPDRKEYEIEKSSGGLGERVLRDVLAREAESPEQAQRREISPVNYDFALVGRQGLDGHQCYVLQITPKREEKDLIRGQIWVDAASFNILRIEGEPMKNPSWWIHDLHILMNFALVDGMWLNTWTQAVAHVRFKGEYTMVSHDLEYRSAEQARITLRPHTPSIVSNAFINP